MFAFFSALTSSVLQLSYILITRYTVSWESELVFGPDDVPCLFFADFP